MKIPCPECSQAVFETAPACPHCGSQLNVEHPGDMPGVKHKPLQLAPQNPIGKAIETLQNLDLKVLRFKS